MTGGLEDLRVFQYLVVAERRALPAPWPRIGIVVLNYSGGDDTAQCLESIRSVAYGRSDGMRNPEANGGNPAGWQTEDGRLWFATAAGLVAIDPATVARSRDAPPAFVEEAWVDGARTDFAQGLDLPPGNHRLQLA